MYRSSGTSKIKVEVEQLLAAVKVRRESLRKAHDKAVAKYEKDTAAFADKVITDLAKAYDSAISGKLPQLQSQYNGNRLLIPTRVSQPSKPSLDLSHIDRLIATLEMSADLTISISADDAAQYLG